MNDYLMSKRKEIERIANLFDVASDINKKFSDKCSETKLLAVRDYYRAEDEYIKLAEKTLSVKGLGIADQNDCCSYISSIKSQLDSGQLNASLIDSLEALRTKYLESVLRPAVRQYIHNDGSDNRELKKIYGNAMKIDNLLEVIQFMSKVQRVE